MYVCAGACPFSVYPVFIDEFVYVLVCIVTRFYWGKLPFNLYATRIYVARNFGGFPACASSADVSVRKCHGTLQGRGRLRVTDSERLLLYGEMVLLRSHEIIVFI